MSSVSFPEGSIVKGPGLVLGYLFMVSQINQSALEQSQLPDGASRARFDRGGRKMGLLSKTSPLGPVDAVPFHGHSHKGQPLNIHTYIIYGSETI